MIKEDIMLIPIIVILVYLFCPVHLKAVILLINCFVPDSIPYIDELLMVAGLLVPSP